MDFSLREDFVFFCQWFGRMDKESAQGMIIQADHLPGVTAIAISCCQRHILARKN